MISLASTLAACTAAQQVEVPANDRIPDSAITRGMGSCVKGASSLPQEDRAPLCTCVFREVQRTMSAQEVLALHEAIEAAGADNAAQNRALIRNDKARLVLVACVNEIYGAAH
jgi:hypothetical protein